MYRSAIPELECPLCKSKSLTEPTLYVPNPNVVFRRTDVGELDKSDHETRVTRARVCTACGHVALCLSEGRLAHLKAALPHLQPETRRE